MQVDIEYSKLQGLLAEIRRLELVSAGLGQQLEEEGNNLREAIEQTHSVSPAELAHLDDYRQYVLREQKNIAVRQQQLGKQADQQRRNVVEARRRHQLLERLKEKALKSWEYEYNKETETLASDLFLARICQERGQR